MQQPLLGSCSEGSSQRFSLACGIRL